MPTPTPIADTALAVDAALENYYRLDGDATDETGAANGTETGMAYSTSASPFGGGIQGGDFSANTAGGSSPTSYIEASFYSPGANDFTYTFWVQFSTLGATQAPVYNEANGATGRPHIEFSFDGTNLSISVADTSSPVSITTSGVVFNTTDWYHVAYTRTGGTGTLYVNAVNEGTVGDTKTTISASNGQIGRRLNTTYSPKHAFDGYVADVAMFSRALTAPEIDELVNGASSATGNAMFMGANF